MNNENVAEFLQEPLQEAFDTECRCYEIYLKAYESMLETWEKLESQADELKENGALAIVVKAMRRGGNFGKKEFEKLPAVVKRAVFSPGQLREWAILEDIDGKTMTVIQANFQRTFRNEMRIEKEKGKLSPDVLKLYSKNDSKKVETSKREVSQIEENDNEKDMVEAPDDIMERVIRRMERE